ncbi:hypothetical protein, partial [Escherichia coli]|uniref:hypothetical protein n=2 Tax=Escherichia coli TaxID=562 RepID=UPI001A7E0D04
RRAESSTATVYQYDNGLLNFLGIPQGNTPCCDGSDDVDNSEIFSIVSEELTSINNGETTSLSLLVMAALI